MEKQNKFKGIEMKRISEDSDTGFITTSKCGPSMEVLERKLATAKETYNAVVTLMDNNFLEYEDSRKMLGKAHYNLEISKNRIKKTKKHLKNKKGK